jgi:hypothetical protein
LANFFRGAEVSAAVQAEWATLARMARDHAGYRAEGHDHRRPPSERWYVQVAVVIVVIAAVIGMALLGDPEHESWQTKAWELVRDVVPHRMTAKNQAADVSTFWP